jgi:CubicO group peptidase (beta-lactamase class C family)
MTGSLSEGHCHPRYAALRAEFDRRLASGDDAGGALCVVEQGECVVDLWGGSAGPAPGSTWGRDTLVNNWSITKAMTALAALVLVDRGELQLDRPLADVVPAFGANGKAGITLRQYLSHTSGLAGWEQPVDLLDLCDLERSTALLAAQAPWWEPGTASGYHMLSFGHPIGAAIRAVTGQSLSDFFRREIAEPLGADYHIGLPVTACERVAETWAAGGPPPLPPAGSIAFKAFTGPAPVPMAVNTIAWRSAEVGAANGHGHARSIAQIQALLSHGGEFAGRRLLRPATIAQALQVQHQGTDLVIGNPIAWGLGFPLASTGLIPFVPARQILVSAGAGGSLLLNDTERASTFAYTMHRMDAGLLGNDNSISYCTLFERLQTQALAR